MWALDFSIADPLKGVVFVCVYHSLDKVTGSKLFKKKVEWFSRRRRPLHQSQVLQFSPALIITAANMTKLRRAQLFIMRWTCGVWLVPLRVVVLVSVQFVRVVRSHVGEVLEDVLVRFIP